MSAVPAESHGARSTRATLTAVPRRRTTVARTPFLVILLGVLGLGMVGLVMLQTTVQQQSFELRKLEAQAKALSYQEAQLQAEADRRSTPAEVARRARELGMVPNPYPVYIDVTTGEVRGVAKPVTGNEMPNLTVKTPEEVARARTSATTQPAPPAPPAEPGDSVANPGAPAAPAPAPSGAAPAPGGQQ